MVVYGMLLFGVYKLFTISSDLSEIKELLKKNLPEAAADTDVLAAHEARIATATREWSGLEPEK
jgi:hypothetical protein